MVNHIKNKSSERSGTDESLRTERRRTDAELAGSLDAIKEDADQVVAEARSKADGVLSEARGQEDRKLAAAGSTTSKTAGLEAERARADAALNEERGDADAAVNGERERREQALKNLLAFERQDTDLRLEIERARADEAVNSREDFFAIVSHDLRALLGGIALNADLLKELARHEEPVNKVIGYAERIQRFSARMNRLIGDLMDVASIEAGKLSMMRNPQDPVRLVAEAIEAFSPAAAARSIELTSQIGEGVGPIEFDHDRIFQVLTNLVQNAIKFTAKGGHVTIGVASHRQDVCFSVKDDGEGIAGDRLDKIFDRFFQSQRNDRRGLGLGLYIARSIVDVHRGKIWAESIPGCGSTFFVTLPTSASSAASPTVTE